MCENTNLTVPTPHIFDATLTVPIHLSHHSSTTRLPCHIDCTHSFTTRRRCHIYCSQCTTARLRCQLDCASSSTLSPPVFDVILTVAILPPNFFDAISTVAILPPQVFRATLTVLYRLCPLFRGLVSGAKNSASSIRHQIFRFGSDCTAPNVPLPLRQIYSAPSFLRRVFPRALFE